MQMKTERVCASFLGGVKEDLEQFFPPLKIPKSEWEVFVDE